MPASSLLASHPRDVDTPSPPSPAAPPPSPDAGVRDARARDARLAALLVLVLAMAGLYVMREVHAVGLHVPLRGSANVFFRLFALHELPALVLVLAFAAASYALVGRGAGGDIADVRDDARWRSSRAPMFAALLVLGVTWLATKLVMHDFPLSMDEYGAAFQARIFQRGQASAVVPQEWREWVGGMLPVFTTYKASDGSWLSLYLPGYAALRAAFLAVRLDSLLNPLLAAISIVALAGIARRLWPGAPGRHLLAVAFLASSAQFLVTAASGYSMTAHLCLNLVWLWLWLRDDRVAIALLPLVGVAALGLHNPFPHALFAAPFLLRRLLQRRWGTVAWTGGVYLAGAAWWLLQLQALRRGLDAGGLSGAFAAPNLLTLYTQGINLSLLMGWQTPLAVVAAAAAFVAWRRLDTVLRDLAAGLLLTLAFYCFFPANQGHGWGYRYAHGVLGSIALLATAGCVTLAQVMGRARFTRLAAASFAVTLLYQLPVRAVETERFVRPFAAASAWIESLPDEVVLVPTHTIWYGRDLVRNDPWLELGPKVMAASALRRGGLEELQRLHPGRVRLLMPADLTRFGLRVVEGAPFR